MSRQFSEKDAAEILRAAAKLQLEASSGSGPTGVSVDDLKKIAEESGIDPGFVEQALLSQAAQGTKGGSKGKLEVTLDGELTIEQFGIVQESLSTLSGYKMLNQVGRTIQGAVQAPWCQLRVEVFSRNGRTKLAVTPIYAMTFMMTGYTPALIGFLATVFGSIRGGIFIGLGLAAIFGAISYLVTMFGIKKANDSAKNVLDQLAADISVELKSNQESDLLLRDQLSGPEPAAVDELESLENRQG